MSSRISSVVIAVLILCACGVLAFNFGFLTPATIFSPGARDSMSGDDALHLAEAYLSKNSVEYDSVLRKGTLHEFNFGWVLYYTTPDRVANEIPERKK
jgi:hypothetical protein